MGIKLSEETIASLKHPTEQDLLQIEHDAYHLLMRCGLLRVRLAPLSTLQRHTYHRKKHEKDGPNMGKERETCPEQAGSVATLLAHMDASFDEVEKSLTERLEESLDASVTDIKGAMRDTVRQM